MACMIRVFEHKEHTTCVKVRRQLFICVRVGLAECVEVRGCQSVHSFLQVGPPIEFRPLDFCGKHLYC